jgi:hypothetical protein
MLLHLQASKLEFWNPHSTVCISVTCAFCTSRKADLTQITQFFPQKSIFATNDASSVSNMIHYRKIYINSGKCVFIEEAFVPCVKSAFLEALTVHESPYISCGRLQNSTILQMNG